MCSLFPIPSALGKALPAGRHGCESGHGGHQQSPSAQRWDSREGAHPLGSSHGLNRSFTFPVSPWAHTDPRAVPAELCLSPSGVLGAGEPLAEHWGCSPQVTGPICQSLLHSWLCGSVNLPGGSQHSSDNKRNSSPALLPAARALFVLSQNICSVSRQKERGCFYLLSKNNLCNLIQVLKGSCWVPCWCVWSSPVSS